MTQLDVVFNHICCYPCSTVADVARALNLDNKVVKSAVQRLRQKGLIVATVSISGIPAQYVQVVKKPVLTEPRNGSTYAQRPDPVFDAPTSAPYRNGTTQGPWTPPQMESVRADGAEALSIPSRVGDELTPHRAPVAMCAGKGVAYGFAPSRMQRQY